VRKTKPTTWFHSEARNAPTWVLSWPFTARLEEMNAPLRKAGAAASRGAEQSKVVAQHPEDHLSHKHERDCAGQREPAVDRDRGENHGERAGDTTEVEP
jgi:hypothetical protein